MRNHFAWTFHNLIAHPASEIAHLVGLSRLSEWIHNSTVPGRMPMRHVVITWMLCIATIALAALLVGCTSTTVAYGQASFTSRRVFSATSIGTIMVTVTNEDGTKTIMRLDGYASTPEAQAIESAVGAAVGAAVKSLAP